MLGTACFFNWFLVKKSVKREISGQFSVKAPYNRTTIFPKRNGFLLYQLHLVFVFFVKKEEQNVRFQTHYRHYYGLWSPPRYLEYLYAQFGYLHRLFCKLGVNSVNMKVFTLFTPFTLNVSVNGVKGVNTALWNLAHNPPPLHGIKGKV